MPFTITFANSNIQSTKFVGMFIIYIHENFTFNWIGSLVIIKKKKLNTDFMQLPPARAGGKHTHIHLRKERKERFYKSCIFFKGEFHTKFQVFILSDTIVELKHVGR
jgi:hypothetical protein